MTSPQTNMGNATLLRYQVPARTACRYDWDFSLDVAFRILVNKGGTSPRNGRHPRPRNTASPESCFFAEEHRISNFAWPSGRASTEYSRIKSRQAMDKSLVQRLLTMQPTFSCHNHIGSETPDTSLTLMSPRKTGQLPRTIGIVEKLA